MKKPIFERQYLPLFVTLFGLYLAISYWPSVAKFIGHVSHATIPLLVGAVLAYIINILLNQWEHLYEKCFPSNQSQGLKRGICIALSYISIVVILGLVLWLVIPEVVACVKLLLAHHSQLIKRAVKYLSSHSFKYIDPNKINWSAIVKEASAGVGGTYQVVKHAASRIITFGTTSIIAIFFSVYLLVFK